MIAVRNRSICKEPGTARRQTKESAQQQYAEILEATTQIIEDETGVTVPRDTTHYARFEAHLQALLKRIFQEKQPKKNVDSSSLQLYHTVRDEYQKIADCVDKIGSYYKSCLSANLDKEEKLYLIMHIGCVCGG